jgi:hypothetical protein
VSVCPALRRRESGFECAHSGRPINPFSWYCIGGYIECPAYVRAARAAQAAPPQQPPAQSAAESQVVPLQQERAEAAEPEKAIRPAVDNVILKYDELIKRLDGMWKEYESGVVEAKKRWEVEKLSLLRARDLLGKTVRDYERALAELELKRDLVPAETYEVMKKDLESRLGSAKVLLDEVDARIAALEDGLNAHFKRVLSTSSSAEIVSLKLSLARLDDLLKEGKISHETYERLKKELEALLK